MFPVSPTDNQIVSISNVEYKFIASKNQWIGNPKFNSVKGGGSVIAPSVYGSFSDTFTLNSTHHDGGSLNASFYNNDGSANTAVFCDRTTINAYQLYASPANLNATLSETPYTPGPGVPQFASVDDYLASNPTYTDYNDGNGAVNGFFWNTTDLAINSTNDSGATFNSFTPSPTRDGAIEVVSAGTYKLKVKHNMKFLGSSYNEVNGATAVYVDGTIVHIAKWVAAYQLNDGGGATSPRLDSDFFECYIVAGAGSQINIGILKLGANIQTTHVFEYNIESMF